MERFERMKMLNSRLTNNLLVKENSLVPRDFPAESLHPVAGCRRRNGFKE